MSQVIIRPTAGGLPCVLFGEGWHNNHHAYQYSARHGLAWWEFDVTWIIIRSLQAVGLADNVKLAKVSAPSNAS